MGPGDELECGTTPDRINGNPEAHVLVARDVVVRLVLMPRRDLAGTGFLREHMVVMESDLPALRQPGGRRGERCTEDHLAVGTVVLPVAEVFDKEPGIVGSTGHDRHRTRLCEVGIDAVSQERDLGRGEQLAKNDRSI